MGVFLAFPIIFILVLLQTTLVNQLTLLSGCADLVLLWIVAWSLQKQVRHAWLWVILAGISVAFVSAIPWYVPVICYAGAAYLAKLVNQRVWQSPILMMFMVTIVSSIFINVFTFVSLVVQGVNIGFQTGLVQVIIPSTLINLLLALPVYAVAKDTAQWLYPVEVTE